MSFGVIIAGSGRGSAFAKSILSRNYAKVLALVDTNTEIHDQLRERLAEYGSPQTEILTTLKEALHKYPASEAQAVFIVTPNNTHAELLRQSLEAGRHVLLEKPVAASNEDLQKIANLARQHPDQIIHLGFGMRYGVLWRKIIELAKSGRLGQICMVQQNEWLDFAHSGNAYRRGWRRHHSVTGGFLNEKCSHDLDMLCELKEHEADPVQVYSVAGMQMFPPHPEAPTHCEDCSDQACPFRCRQVNFFRYQLGSRDFLKKCVFNSDADVFNIQSATIKFSDGTQAIHTLLPYAGLSSRRWIIIHGNEGFLQGEAIEGQAYSLKGTFYRESGMQQIDFPLEYDKTSGHGGSDRLLLEGFFNCLKNNQHPEAGLYDGIRASMVAFAADESAQTGAAIDLRPRLNAIADLKKRGN